MYAYLWFECFSLSIKMYDTRLNINVQGKAVMQCFYFLSSRGKKIMIYDIICHVHKCMQLCLFLNYVHVPLKIIHVRQCGNTCNIKEDKKGVWRILLERERESFQNASCWLYVTSYPSNSSPWVSAMKDFLHLVQLKGEILDIKVVLLSRLLFHVNWIKTN